ncbi:MFS transporter [Microbacterium trichothecenolyticum]|uniref:MFS family permease n=1 Tax=Microbacterium trichothecenolyticum TaxID=69370 RepID=A0ABU0TVJ4_MICTR|nr:MFS transporter [Microbacterium trichothecenolyticum]MDQ1123686.1 MFS family permease [Microbacterium trichothecenolyticum]
MPLTPDPSADEPSHVAAPRVAPTPVLLGTQMLFNIGFFAVVPFLALVLTGDFGLTAAAVGLILGVRTFAQQGMFLVGGVLADRFGARRTILTGCAVRVLGFATLAISLLPPTPQLAAFVAGTVLTGLGGALFSPGLNVLVADAEARRAPASSRSRASLFAWLSVSGELGAVVGPLVGAALLGWGFVVVAFAGAALFVLIGVFLAVALPRRTSSAREQGIHGRWWSLRDRRFLAFSALHAADLLAFNQLYLALPLQLARTDAGAGVVALMFAWVSILTLVLQLPMSRWCHRVGAARALRVGYGLSGAGFAVVASTTVLPLDDTVRIAAVFVAAGLVIVGHLTTNPTAQALVPLFAGTLPTGSFFGLLSTCGGVAVLVGNVVVGALLGWTAVPAVAWLVLAAPLVVAAVLAPSLAAGAGRASTTVR